MTPLSFESIKYMQTDFEKVKPVADGEVNAINKWLLGKYGTGLQERPIFRVCWSEDLIEKRRGNVNASGIVTSMHRDQVTVLRKYDYLKDRWILEKLVYSPHDEIVGSEHGHYEPTYVFQSWKDNSYLPPNRRAVELYLNTILTGSPMPKEDWEAKSADSQKREIKIFEDYLGEDMSDFQLSLRNGEAVILSGASLDGTSIEKVSSPEEKVSSSNANDS